MTVLQAALQAGARAIELNKRLEGMAYCYDMVNGRQRQMPYADAAKLLRNTDVAEVVRCKNCRWYVNDCVCVRDSNKTSVEREDFCSYGEKRKRCCI